jgi:hypothetical protein
VATRTNSFSRASVSAPSVVFTLFASYNGLRNALSNFMPLAARAFAANSIERDVHVDLSPQNYGLMSTDSSRSVVPMAMDDTPPMMRFSV